MTKVYYKLNGELGKAEADINISHEVAVQLLTEMNIRPDDGRVMLVYKGD